MICIASRNVFCVGTVNAQVASLSLMSSICSSVVFCEADGPPVDYCNCFTAPYRSAASGRWDSCIIVVSCQRFGKRVATAAGKNVILIETGGVPENRGMAQLAVRLGRDSSSSIWFRTEGEVNALLCLSRDDRVHVYPPQTPS
jgi:hypothetical protein